MPFFDGFELIDYALEKEKEDKLMLRWSIHYQHAMDFDEFKRQVGVVSKQKRDNRTAGEILQSVREIIG